jgi:hypothetical protein
LITNQSLPDPAPDLLQKPFLPQVLVRKVREILDQVPCGAKVRLRGGSLFAHRRSVDLGPSARLEQ